MKQILKKLTQLGAAALFFTSSLSASAWAGTMILTSEDISHGDFMGKAHEFQGFGCTGEDKSPQLSWSGAPKDTKAFAVFAYDPDAPTGSGWWHWQLINIPADVTSLATGTGKKDPAKLPKGSMQMRNDYGAHAFGGACPPEGDGAHRYQLSYLRGVRPAALRFFSIHSRILSGYGV